MIPDERKKPLDVVSLVETEGQVHDLINRETRRGARWRIACD